MLYNYICLQCSQTLIIFSYFIPRKQSSTNLILLQKQTVIEPRDKKKVPKCWFQSCGGSVACSRRGRKHEDVRWDRDARGGAMRQDGSRASAPGPRCRPGHPGLATEHGARSSGTVPTTRHSGHHRGDKKCVSAATLVFFLPPRRDIPSKRAVQLTRHVSGEKKRFFLPLSIIAYK